MSSAAKRVDVLARHVAAPGRDESKQAPAVSAAPTAGTSKFRYTVDLTSRGVLTDQQRQHYEEQGFLVCCVRAWHRAYPLLFTRMYRFSSA